MSNILTMDDEMIQFEYPKQPTEEIDYFFIKNLFQNPSELNILNIKDQNESEHQHLISPISETGQSQEQETASSNQSTQNLSQERSDNGNNRGSWNSIPSNLVREFIHTIRQQLKFTQKPLKRINQFIVKNNIKSQRWAIQALLLILLFQRDQIGQISHNEFMKIRSHFLNKLIEKKGRTKLSKSKQMFEIYINHVEKYDETQFGVASIKFIEEDSRNLFSSIVIKRKIQIENYLGVLRILHESLEQKAKDKKTIVDQEI